MEKKLLTFVIVGDNYNENDGECYRYYDDGEKQHIDALFSSYDYFKCKDYYITLFRPFKSINSFVEMVVLNGHVVFVNVYNEGLLFVPDYMTEKQKKSLQEELSKLSGLSIKVSINLQPFIDINEFNIEGSIRK
ncbi:MAG: hypothetical protein MR411_02885 [Tenericutes bacterium]|nr:hypothetical protein [Mycoplasmatota bacterium]